MVLTLVRRAGYFLFVIVTRIFWIAVCAALLGGLFARVYPNADGFNRMVVDVFAIFLGFAILRLASARPGKPSRKRSGPAT